MPIEAHVHRKLGGTTLWLWDHIYLPMARVFLIIAFLVLCYPAPLLPADWQLPSGYTQPPLQSLMNWMFFGGLLLPMLPLFDRFSSISLLAQACIGALLFLGHAAQVIDKPLHWPGFSYVIGILMMAFLMHYVIRFICLHMTDERRVDQSSLYDGLALVTQVPFCLLLTRAMG